MPLHEVVLAGCGAAAILLGICWRTISRWRANQVVDAALVSADPQERIAAIRVAAGQGLGRHASAFLRLAKGESDPDVRQVLIEVVVNNQWEPLVSTDLAVLRLWAHTEFEPRRRNGRLAGSSMRQLRHRLRLVAAATAEPSCIDEPTPDGARGPATGDVEWA